METVPEPSAIPAGQGMTSPADPPASVVPDSGADQPRVAASSPGKRPATRHAGLRYLGLRTALLVGIGCLLFVLGLRGLLLIVLAFLISGLISLFLLSPQRNAAAGNLERAFQRMNRRIERGAAAEDEAVEAVIRSQEPTAGPPAATSATTAPTEPVPTGTTQAVTAPTGSDPVDAAPPLDVTPVHDKPGS